MSRLDRPLSLWNWYWAQPIGERSVEVHRFAHELKSQHPGFHDSQEWPGESWYPYEEHHEVDYALDCIV